MNIIFFALIMNIYGTVDYCSMLYNLDKTIVIKLVAAESSFNSKSISNKNAKGLMQLQPATAKEMAKREGINGELDLHNNQTNIWLGCAYLRWLLDYYNQDYTKALIAYNMGLGTYRRKGKAYDDTLLYVNKILGDKIVSTHSKNYTKEI